MFQLKSIPVSSPETEANSSLNFLFSILNLSSSFFSFTKSLIAFSSEPSVAEPTAILSSIGALIRNSRSKIPFLTAVVKIIICSNKPQYRPLPIVSALCLLTYTKRIHRIFEASNTKTVTLLSRSFSSKSKGRIKVHSSITFYCSKPNKFELLLLLITGP